MEACSEHVLVEVNGNGSGLDATTPERVFTVFFTTKFTDRRLRLAAVLGSLRGHAVLVVAKGRSSTVDPVIEPERWTPEYGEI